MSNFHIGQEVVCINPHGTGNRKHPGDVLKKGAIYKINALRSNTCSCKYIMVDVGIKTAATVDECTFCGNMDVKTDDTRWFADYRFAPLQTKSEEEDMNEAIEEALSQPAFQ